MTKAKFPKEGRFVVGIFGEVPEFKAALEELLKRGFDRASVSVLADRQALSDHFDGKIPSAEELADRADTPREDLDTEGALEGAIRFIAESLSVLSVIGAAGAAYAVGGPVGVAVGTGAATEASLEGVLARAVDDSYSERYQQSVRDGGVVCWVHARSAVEATTAHDVLRHHGGSHLHEIAAP